MDVATHHARVTGQLTCRTRNGRTLNIPIGPCLVESLDGRSIDVVWGAKGQRSVALPIEAFESAHACGHLVLLD